MHWMPSRTTLRAVVRRTHHYFGANPGARLISIPGGEHGLAGGDRKLIDEAHTAAADFIRKHLGKP